MNDIFFFGFEKNKKTSRLILSLKLVLLNQDLSFFENTVDSYLLASDSEFTLYSTQLVNTYGKLHVNRIKLGEELST